MANVLAAITFSGVGSQQNINTGLQYPAGTNVIPSFVAVTCTADSFEGYAAKPAGVVIHGTTATDNVIDITFEGNAQVQWTAKAEYIA